MTVILGWPNGYIICLLPQNICTNHRDNPGLLGEMFAVATNAIICTIIMETHNTGCTVSRSVMHSNVNYMEHLTLRCRSSASRRILARRIWDLLCCITRLSNVAICWLAIDRISASSTRASAAAKLSLCNAARGSLKSKGLKRPWFNSCFTLSDLK